MLTWIKWWAGANAAIYSCHFLACWSGRMWSFSMGLVLMHLSPDSLHLSATYGLSLGAVVLVFGAVVGDWVDHTTRWRAAVVSMVCQNMLISACAGVVLILILLESASWLTSLLIGLLMFLSICSRLVKEARTIVLERDWVVEMCARSQARLSVMTSTFRRIDLLTKILAPLTSGQVLTFAGLKVGCGCMVLWCGTSVVIEYFLVRRVYRLVPALRITKRREVLPENPDDFDKNQVTTNSQEMAPLDTAISTGNEFKQEQAEEEAGPANVRRGRGLSCLCRSVSGLLILYRGLRSYFSHVTRWAGLALACLYMTVLGFDDVTVGYATTQGVSGSWLGILVAVGAGLGVLATLTYPWVVQRCGLSLTGVLAIGLQVTCLTLCVTSVWLPGSPFNPGLDLSQNFALDVVNNTLLNCTADQASTNTTVCVTNSGGPNTDPGGPIKDPSVSVWVLLAGIVLARVGLWTADLTITQLFLENIPPGRRGIINGFQTSLNQLMDFNKYALVVILPYPHQFGLLVFVSYFSVCCGWALMGVNWTVMARRKGKQVLNQQSVTATEKL